MVERRGEGDRREPWREGTRRRRQRDRGVSRGPKAKERTCSRLLQKLVLRDPKATLESLGGQLLDDFRSRIRWWKGVAKEIAGSLGGRVLDAADSGRQRDRGVSRGPKAKERACSRLLQKLVLRDRKRR